MSGFSTAWLDARYRADEAARNPETEAAVWSMCSGIQPLRVLDLGAGTCAAFRHLAPRGPARQRWTALEQDPLLLGAAQQLLPGWAAGAGYTAGPDAGGWAFRSSSQALHLRMIGGDLHSGAAWEAAGPQDLIVAHALLDLCSAEQLRALAARISGQAQGLYALLNYTGMRAWPQMPEDGAVFGWYEAHMQRPQPFGRACGREAPAVLREAFAALGWQVRSGASRWVLGPGEQAMHAFLLGFMEQSVPEMAEGPGGLALFRRWLAARRAQSQAGQLTLDVEHEDLLAAAHGLLPG